MRTHHYILDLLSRGIILAFCAAHTSMGQVLTNGDWKDGTVTASHIEDAWTFEANAGDLVYLRGVKLAGTSSFYPWLRLFGPGGVPLFDDAHPDEARITFTATNCGTFTVLVGSYYSGNTGDYRLRLAKVPGAYITPAGDESGTLTNGGSSDGTIAVGDDDFWTFEANAGDLVYLRGVKLAGTSSFYPWLRLFGPGGVPLFDDSHPDEARITFTATHSGTFTVVVGSYYRGSAGNYRLRLAKVPGAYITPAGDESGTLTNDGSSDGTIAVGDDDFWTFEANAGDLVYLRGVKLAGTSSFYPWLRLFGPGGVPLFDDSHPDEARIEFTATNSGTFTVLVGSYYRSSSGNYLLRLAKVPGAYITPAGDESGTLTNGGSSDGTIAVGDDDFWTFEANAGDLVYLRGVKLAGTSSFYPWLRLFGPGGVPLFDDSHPDEARIEFTATTSGTFTVVVGSYYRGSAGNYRLRLAKVPGAYITPAGDESGTLTNGGSTNGTIAVGDDDFWNFNACKGDRIVVQCQKLSGDSSFSPWLRVFGPNGTLIAAQSHPSLTSISFRATVSGRYLMLVGSYYAGKTGTYRLTGSGVSDGLKLCVPCLSGTNLVISSVGGVTNANFLLRTTTNIATPANLWTILWSNQFDAFGVFNYTNELYRSERERYFLLELP